MYPDKFFSFKDGAPIDDNQVNEWLEKIRRELIEQKNGGRYSISSGDTFVIGLKYDEVYNFIVANKDGYSEYTIYRESEDIEDVRFI